MRSCIEYLSAIVPLAGINSPEQKGEIRYEVTRGQGHCPPKGNQGSRTKEPQKK